MICKGEFRKKKPIILQYTLGMNSIVLYFEKKIFAIYDFVFCLIRKKTVRTNFEFRTNNPRKTRSRYFFINVFEIKTVQF